MRQQDHNVPRPQNFRRMPAQQQPMQYQQPQNLAGNFSQPRPTMAGGNFAPRPGNPQTMMQNGMFGNGAYQQNNDTMPGFEGKYNGEDWNNIKLGDVRDQMGREQAQASVDEMDKWLEEMNGQVDMSVHTAGNVEQVTSALDYVIKLLNEPEGWMPSQSKYMAAVKTKGASVSKQLTIFRNAIAQLK